MAITVTDKNLGHATAYGYAKSKGYTGTEEEFAELMASYATVAEQAQQSAEEAAQSADNAEASAILATEQAQESANSASVSAGSASQSSQSASSAAQSAESSAHAAGIAVDKASEAATSAQTASTKAGEAAASATAAQTARTGAETARTGAETARTGAEAAQEAAEEAARTLTIDATLTQTGQAADAKKTGDEISDLKDDLNQLSIEEILLRSELPGTAQTVTMDSSGNPTSIVHSKDGSTVRTDTFTWSTSSVSEIRTADGKCITIMTDLVTLASTISEIQEVA